RVVIPSGTCPPGRGWVGEKYGEDPRCTGKAGQNRAEPLRRVRGGLPYGPRPTTSVLKTSSDRARRTATCVVAGTAPEIQRCGGRRSTRDGVVLQQRTGLVRSAPPKAAARTQRYERFSLAAR